MQSLKMLNLTFPSFMSNLAKLKNDTTPYKLVFPYPDWEKDAINQFTDAIATDYPIIAIDHADERWYITPHELAVIVMDAADTYRSLGSPPDCFIEIFFSAAHRYNGEFSLVPI